MKIWANTIVNNEEKFIWFAIMSIVDWVDKVLVYDTGSTDNTVEIIKRLREIKGDKVDFREIGEVGDRDFPKVRQAMLDASECDWILILDGDEIWWARSIEKLVDKIKKVGDKIDGIVVPMIVSVGDIYHRQEEAAGKYKIIGKKGHYSLRAFSKKIPGLHLDWPYGKETFFDINNLPIQDRKNIIFLDASYLHVTHLRRSSKKRKFNKVKLELGESFPKDFKFPEVFYNVYPKIVPSPWTKISGRDLVWAKVLTPLRKIKRKII